MMMIYGQANRVIVWLGEAADNSDLALKEIRSAPGDKANMLSKNDRIISDDSSILPAIVALLRRPWFQRIWVRSQILLRRCNKH
jgi:hypothetical protein